MCTNAGSPFPPDALEANRRGKLSDAQCQRIRGLSRRRRKGALSIAGFLAAGALLIDLNAAPALSVPKRILITLFGLGIAAFLVVRAISGADALTRDLRRRRVQFIEGAIGKASQSIGEGDTTYFLDVGDARFTVMPMTYDAAPDAGYVRLYFLPDSRVVVNLERLPDSSMGPGATPQDILQSLVSAVGFRDRRMLNEARAAMAGMGDALKSSFAQPVAPPPGARDPRPLSETILGTWSNGFVTARFLADGRVTSSVLGREKAGRWSIDADGRLCADVTGQEQAVEAWVAGDRLTISAEGKGLTLTRQA